MSRAFFLLCLATVYGQDVSGDGGDGSCDAGKACVAAKVERKHHWPMQKGNMERTGYSPYVMPNISAGPSWSWVPKEFDLEIHRATPLIDDQKNIYVQSIAGRVRKLRGTDGVELWSFYSGDRGGIPGVAAIDDDKIFFMTRKGYFIAVDLETGTEVFSTKIAELIDSTTDCLLVLQGLVIYAIVEPVPAVYLTGHLHLHEIDSNLVVAFSTKDGSLKWRFQPYTPLYNFQASSINDGSFVFQDQTGGVYRLGVNDGKLLWYGGQLDRGSATTAAAVISEGKVYAVSNLGGGMKPGMKEGKGLLHVYDYESGLLLWYQLLWYEGNQAVAVGEIAGHPGKSLVLGMGKNPGVPWFMLMTFYIPGWLIPWTAPLYYLSLHFPTWFASKQGRAIVAFNAETGALRWVWEMEPYQQMAASGDNEKFVPRFREFVSTNPNNEPMCLPDANAQPVIDGSGTAFVMNFLDFGGYWDPSLAFVMGCGICAPGVVLISGPAFIMAEQLRKVTTPLCEGCKFENPPKKGNYLPLVLGASCFGLGWGLIGLCPGPALVAIIPKIVTGIWGPWQPDFALSAAALVICISWLTTDRLITHFSAKPVATTEVKAGP